jgi:transcription termination factor NusB
MKKKQKRRHLDISTKLLNMANALSKEADESDDVILAQVSNLIMLVSGVMTEKEDIDKLSDICAMFSAKKILDELEDGDTLDLS